MEVFVKTLSSKELLAQVDVEDLLETLSDLEFTSKMGGRYVPLVVQAAIKNCTMTTLKTVPYELKAKEISEEEL